MLYGTIQLENFYFNFNHVVLVEKKRSLNLSKVWVEVDQDSFSHSLNLKMQFICAIGMEVWFSKLAEIITFEQLEIYAPSQQILVIFWQEFFN